MYTLKAAENWCYTNWHPTPTATLAIGDEEERLTETALYRLCHLA